MNLHECFVISIKYIENHLLENIDIKDIAKNAYISPFYFQKVFSIYAGYSVSEYIRSRRLYQAALDIRSSNTSIIDIAYKYLYETPEAFTKAFKRFHGVSPSIIRKDSSYIKVFQPLQINISVVGGEKMEYKIEKENELTFIGFKTVINDGEGYDKCPKFWEEINDKYFCKMHDGSAISKAIIENIIGEFALCKNNQDGKTFTYMICGLYKGKEVPEGLSLITLPSSLWAKFRSVGPIPGALQATNSEIYKKWLVNNPQYSLSFEADVEWYSNGNINSSDYESSIWLPIKEK